MTKMKTKGITFNSVTLKGVNRLYFDNVFFCGVVPCFKNKSLTPTCPYLFWLMFPPVSFKKCTSTGEESYECSYIQTHPSLWQYFCLNPSIFFSSFSETPTSSISSPIWQCMSLMFTQVDQEFPSISYSRPWLLTILLPLLHISPL